MDGTQRTDSVFDEIDPNALGYNSAQLLEHWASVQPGVVAVARADGRDSDGRSRFLHKTFAELNTLADNYAHALKGAGVKAGDRVVLFLTDPIELFASVYACAKLQAVFVLIDPGMGVKNLLACIEEQRPTAFVAVAKAHVLRLLFPRAFKTLKVKVLVGRRFFPGAKAMSSLTGELPSSVRDQPFARDALDPKVPAAILYTSGSTGVPKGVVFTHAMMGGQQRGIRAMLDYRPGEAHVACFPPFALIAASLGMSAIVPEMDVTKPAETDPERVLDAFRAYGATSAFGSPALWEPFSRFVIEKHVTLPDVTRLATAGAPVQPALHVRLLRALPNGDVFTPYGATEALPISQIGGRQVLNETAALTRQGKGTCVGVPVSEVDVRIVRITDEALPRFTEGLEVPRGEVGEICVRGAYISRQYDQRPEHNALSKMETEDGGWYHRMGDVGYLDDEGRLWFCGRKAHRVQSEDGTVLFSVPVEALFEEHASVSRAALAWIGERPRQTPVVCVELVPGHVSSSKLIEELRSIAAAHEMTKGVERFLVHPGFPVDRRHNAKIEREKLAAWASSLPPPATGKQG